MSSMNLFDQTCTTILGKPACDVYSGKWDIVSGLQLGACFCFRNRVFLEELLITLDFFCL